MARELARKNLVVGDEWREYSLWHGQTLTMIVGSQPVEVQFSSAQPPQPALWNSDPIVWPPGEYSRARSYGYVRMRNATRGAVASVSFWANAE